MKRKRFVKLLMALGESRNVANIYAEFAIDEHNLQPTYGQTLRNYMLMTKAQKALVENMCVEWRVNQ